MMVCTSYFVKACRPKFLQKTLAMLELAEGSCFLRESDLKDFVNQLKEQLERDKPIGSSYQVYITDGMWEEDGAQLIIDRRDSLDATIARASFKGYFNIYRLSEVNGTWCNVYARVED